MIPFDSLTEKDRGLIEDYITWFGVSSGDDFDFNNYAGIDNILKEWNDKKQTLFDMFGQKLILTRPYSYKYNTQGLAREIRQAMDDVEYKNFVSWWAWDVKHNSDVKFEIITERSGYYSKYYYIEQIFDAETLAANAYTGSEYKVQFEDGTMFKVSSGMKPMKILHKFIEKYGKPKDEEMFERFRIWHSRLLNQKTMDGDLCLSIHPLDYITMSDNANNWTSCMRWTDKYGNSGDPGDYRGGTVECMNSPYIVIAYLHNKNHEFTLRDHWKWNSKRWRELFIVNDGCISEIKGYPYQDENLTNTCLMWLKELTANYGWTYNDEEVNMKNSVEGPEEDSILSFDFIKPDCMYKDIGSLDKHAGRINKKVLMSKYLGYTMETPSLTTYFIDIPYGGQRTCMCCGRDVDSSINEKAVMCSNCDRGIVCGCCGAYIYDSDEVYWVDDNDEPLCYNCWCDETSMDDITEETHMTNNMTEVWLLLGYDRDKEPVWYRDKSLNIYEPFYSHEFLEVFTDTPNDCKIGWDRRYYVTTDMIKDGKYQYVMNLFEIRDDYELYPDELYYYSDMTLVYPKEEEEDE